MSTDTSVETDVRVVKSDSCPSISGKSKLTYQFGCKNGSDLQMRISHNTGGGFFSEEWVDLAEIHQILQSNDAQDGLTSMAFKTLFKGKSVNTAGFLLAVLKHEGVIRPRDDKSRRYEVVDLERFLASIRALIQTRPTEASPIQNKPPTAGKKHRSIENAKKE